MNFNFEALEKQYKEKLQNHPDSYEANFSLACLYSDHQKYEQALPFFKKAVEIVPASAKAHIMIGEIYFLQESYLEAGENCLKALEIEPDNSEALNNLGVLLFIQGEYSEAEAKLKASIALCPDCFDAALNLGVLYLRMDEIEQAIQMLQKASALNPDSAKARELLEECHKIQENTRALDRLFSDIDEKSGEREGTLYFPHDNDEMYIDNHLEDALKQTYPIEEMLVINDGSTNSSMELISLSPVKFIKPKVNNALTLARHTVIQSASGGFIASSHSDCMLQGDWVKRFVGNFTSEQIVSVGGKVLEAHTATMANLWRFIHLLTYLWRRN